MKYNQLRISCFIYILISVLFATDSQFILLYYVIIMYLYYYKCKGLYIKCKEQNVANWRTVVILQTDGHSAKSRLV